MDTLIYLLKIILILILAIFCVKDYIKEFKNNKNNIKTSPDTILGIILIISLFTTKCHWISLISNVVVLSLYIISFVLLNKKWTNFKNKHYKLMFVYSYVLPVILFVFVYTLPLFILYGINSMYIAISIYQIICMMIILDIILYIVFHLKYVFLIIRNRINFKHNKCKKMSLNEIYSKYPISYIILIFILYVPMILM